MARGESKRDLRSWVFHEAHAEKSSKEKKWQGKIKEKWWEAVRCSRGRDGTMAWPTVSLPLASTGINFYHIRIPPV